MDKTLVFINTKCELQCLFESVLFPDFQQKSNVTIWSMLKFGQVMEKRQLVQGGNVESKSQFASPVRVSLFI